MQLPDLPTPQVVVDRSRALRNIQRAQEVAAAAGARLRPHAKTHKSPVAARWQIEAGAAGICCAQLGEAEVFAGAGIADIRLPYPINPSNAARLLALMDRAAISIIVDHLEVARAWSAVMRRAGRRLDVLVKVDVGFHRCGIDPDADPLAFVQAIDGLDGLRLRGLLSHAGHAYQAPSERDLRAIALEEARILTGLRDRAAASGIGIEELSVGATPLLRFAAAQRGITEIRAGNYIYFDRTQVALGSAALDDCALMVLATVVSKPAPDRIILDCGSKTLTGDQARGFSPMPGYGAILDEGGTGVDGTLVLERLSEEHATVRVAGSTRLEPGARVFVVPNHSCVVSNLVDEIVLVDGNRILERMEVAARGRIQ
ncbi:MAG: alanine racemase [Acidobacteria bacterium]|nr:alanine racemase [Acidobacteriota bacterium]